MNFISNVATLLYLCKLIYNLIRESKVFYLTLITSIRNLICRQKHGGPGFNVYRMYNSFQ